MSPQAQKYLSFILVGTIGYVPPNSLFLKKKKIPKTIKMILFG